MSVPALSASGVGSIIKGTVSVNGVGTSGSTSGSGQAAVAPPSPTPVPTSAATPAPSPVVERDINLSEYVLDTPTPVPPAEAAPASTMTRAPGFAVLLALTSVIIAALVISKKNR